MSNAFASWVVAGGVALVMLQFGLRTKMLSLPEVATRCSACRRLVRRGQTCRCTERGAT